MKKIYFNFCLVIFTTFYALPVLADLADTGAKIGSWSDYLTGNTAVGAIVGLEFVFRLFKTEKPRSLVRGIAAILRGISKLTDGIASAMDKVVPDRTS